MGLKHDWEDIKEYIKPVDDPAQPGPSNRSAQRQPRDAENPSRKRPVEARPQSSGDEGPRPKRSRRVPGNPDLEALQKRFPNRNTNDINRDESFINNAYCHFKVLEKRKAIASDRLGVIGDNDLANNHGLNRSQLKTVLYDIWFDPVKI
ncbi:hypothetical protein [Brucella sp. LJL56]